MVAAGVCVLSWDLFITTVFGCLSAVQASMELVEMTERQDLLWQVGSLSLEQQSPKARVASRGWRGGVVTRVKDGCHTEPELKVGQFSENNTRGGVRVNNIPIYSLRRCLRSLSAVVSV